MTSTDLFRQHAVECRRLAGAARNTSDKKFWLGLVERWHVLESRWQALESRSVSKPAADEARLRRLIAISFASLLLTFPPLDGPIQSAARVFLWRT
jgi:hypothetical protein